VTGVSFLTSQLLGKRLELAAQLVRKRSAIGFLGRPREPRYAAGKKEIESAAAALGQEVRFFEINDERDLDASFAAAAQQNVSAMVVDGDAFFNSNRDALIPLATRYSLPMIYEAREFVTAGGLMSYGASIVEAYHQAGRYVGRILQGEKPGDLPVIQSARFELLINLKTAKTLGLVIPPSILAQAYEVIE
jgi:putative tryptophan/tyrosine transport system substrate-binding protein